MTGPHELAALVEAYLDELALTPELGELAEPIRYALAGGGKRIRPVLCLATGEALGREPEELLPAGAAVELVHNFSLVHDDLPALDDAQAIGGPAFRGRRDAPVELFDARGDCVRCVAGELVHFALVQRGQGLTRHVPLVKEEEGRATGGAATERHTSSSIATSTRSTSIPHICSSAAATCPWTSSAS